MQYPRTASSVRVGGRQMGQYGSVQVTDVDAVPLDLIGGFDCCVGKWTHSFVRSVPAERLTHSLLTSLNCSDHNKTKLTPFLASHTCIESFAPSRVLVLQAPKRCQDRTRAPRNFFGVDDDGRKYRLRFHPPPSARAATCLSLPCVHRILAVQDFARARLRVYKS